MPQGDVDVVNHTIHPHPIKYYHDLQARTRTTLNPGLVVEHETGKTIAPSLHVPIPSRSQGTTNLFHLHPSRSRYTRSRTLRTHCCIFHGLLGEMEGQLPGWVTHTTPSHTNTPSIHHTSRQIDRLVNHLQWWLCKLHRNHIYTQSLGPGTTTSPPSHNQTSCNERDGEEK
jgi:hypothetical protein